MPHPCGIEVMASTGLEWLVIDMEHSATDLTSCLQGIQVIQSKGIDALVRVAKNEEVIIKKSMDMGATGVIVPLVKNASDAKKAADYTKYPPLGVRGVGLYRAQGYGASFEEYKQWVNKNSVVIVQIEHIESVENLEEILAVDEIDGIMVGPYDLSASMGHAGEFDHPEVLKSLKYVVETSKKSTKSLGFHVIPPDYSELNKKIDEGYNFLAFSIDFLFLGEAVKKQLKKVRKN